MSRVLAVETSEEVARALARAIWKTKYGNMDTFDKLPAWRQEQYIQHARLIVSYLAQQGVYVARHVPPGKGES